MSQDSSHRVDSTPHGSPAPSDLGLNNSAGRLLWTLLGPLAEELGHFIADTFRHWRWRHENVDKVAQRHEAEKEARGISEDALAPVSQGNAYRLTEGCSFEDDETVQELWAGLITSAMEPGRENTATRAFIEILKAIGPIEAGLLVVISEAERPSRPPHAPPDLNNLSEEELRSVQHDVYQDRQRQEDQLIALADRMIRHFSENQKELAIQNLFRLRCVGLRTGRNLDPSKTRSALRAGIRGTDTAPSYQAYSEAVNYLEWLALIGSGTGHYKQGPLSYGYSRLMQAIPELQFQLTHMGRALMSSCMTDALRQTVIQESPTRSEDGGQPG